MSLIKETDYGTPKVISEKMVTLEIDGQEITVPEGTSIMRAAMELGTKIPKLCATDMMDAFGSCRPAWWRSKAARARPPPAPRPSPPASRSVHRRIALPACARA